MMRFMLTVSISGLLALTSGCVAGRNTTSGAAVGTGLGALTGAVIGSQSGHAGGGAAIGALTGALAGGLIGNAEDAYEERDAVIAHAQYERAVQQAHAQAMNNSDLIFMAQSGVSEDVIKTAVNTRGGNFDLSPAAIVHLKNNGVSDRVILAVQSVHVAAQSVVVPTRQIYAPVPLTEVVVVPARRTIGFGVEFGPRHHWGPPRHRW
jgi:outer membrane lipoprotein SlyB